MAGFIPAIHVFRCLMRRQDVDGRDKPGHDVVNTIGFEEVTAISYFFAGGAIFDSAGLAASGFAAVSSGLSRRSTLAASRSFAT
jgi:hypothetical protein